MTDRPASPSEIRLAALCALRRELSEYEKDEVKHLRCMIVKAAARRRRYAENSVFREREKARCAALDKRRRQVRREASDAHA